MCIFSGRVSNVTGTNIFCRDAGDEHVTVYEMRADIQSEMAMILPVPFLRAKGEDGLTFVNLETYPDFFKDMKKLFPEPVGRGVQKGLGVAVAGGTLKVHDVGRYIASFVPALRDVHRLDVRFRLPRMLWDELPNYLGHGFAVFQLKPGGGPQGFHPMAYKYQPQDKGQLFFPTVHVHDEAVPKLADYDHRLYFQNGGEFRKAGWQPAVGNPSDKMHVEMTQGLVDALGPVERLTVRGSFENHDHLLMAELKVSKLTYNHIRKSD